LALIIQIMRIVLLILMIALLPLRGWAGDAMAMQQTTKRHHAMEILAASADAVRTEDTFYSYSAGPQLPCHEIASDNGLSWDSDQHHSANASGKPAEHEDCNQCNSCQVCHSVALYPFTSPVPIVALPTPVQSKGLTLFASVPHAPHLKPPIS
jgi:hypothetical protein